jgi:CubicO group peptidase (beta-lactamase class C family)
MKNIKTMLFFLTMILTVQIVISQSIYEDDRIKQRIDDYLTKGVSNGLSGTVLVYKEGKILLNKGYGFADKENETLNTPNTVLILARFQNSLLQQLFSN